MNHQITPTIEELVDMVFTKLNLTYGRDFSSRWEGIDMQDVKNDWVHELAGFERNPHAIKYALRNLPDLKPPTVIQFRAICTRAPEGPPSVMLDRPAANPEVVRQAIAQARAALTRAAQ